MNESSDSISSRAGNRSADLKQRIKRDGKEKIESGKRAAADQIDEIADAIDAAGLQLDQSQPTLANYASKLADGVGGVAARLRAGSIEDLYQDVRRLATQHPAMFLLGGAAVGLAIARFMKVEGETANDSSRGTYSPSRKDLASDPANDDFPNADSTSADSTAADSPGDDSRWADGSDTGASTTRQDSLTSPGAQAAGA